MKGGGAARLAACSPDHPSRQGAPLCVRCAEGLAWGAWPLYGLLKGPPLRRVGRADARARLVQRCAQVCRLRGVLRALPRAVAAAPRRQGGNGLRG